MESEDDILFQEFANDTKYFKETRRNHPMSALDYSATDKAGRKCQIELKKRNFTCRMFATTAIECEKFWLMYNRWLQYGYVPLYINFFNDAILVFDLRKIEDPDKTLKYHMMTITNKGYGEKQKVYRIELPNDIALVYIKDDNGKYKLKDGGWTK